MKLTFHGGAETVTGSKILLEAGYKKIMIDCGLFQGLKELRLKNREELPVNLNDLNFVFLTHAHYDHTGYLPILIKNGYKGSIYCSEATKDLAEIILLDSGKIQEEEAKRANKYGYSKHKPAKPLYTVDDVKKTIPHFKTFSLNEWHKIDDDISFKFLNSGHILGSTFILFNIKGKTIVFSGDIGRKEPIILNKYEYIDKADYLVIESTYGNRLHKKEPVEEKLLKYIQKTYDKKGILIIPTFSVERAQEIIYLLSKLKQQKLLPNIPIYLDSPMGVNATQIYFSHKQHHKLSDDDMRNMMNTVELISNFHASRALVNDDSPKVVMAGSGMITGGRVLHYLEKHISSEKCSILMVGYQAEGTRGKSLVSGDHEIKFFGKYHKVNAKIYTIDALSGHADQSELIDWLKHFKINPRLTFINHGEPHQSQALKSKIKDSLNWRATVAKLNNQYYLN